MNNSNQNQMKMTKNHLTEATKTATLCNRAILHDHTVRGVYRRWLIRGEHEGEVCAYCMKLVNKLP